MKRNSYAVICDKQFEAGLNDVEKVIYLKNLGEKTTLLLLKTISCILGVASTIEETYGLCYDEILEVLQIKYGYTVVDKVEMIEPCKYMTFDTFYAWEVFAQNQDYAQECKELEVEGVKELLTEIMNRPVNNN